MNIATAIQHQWKAARLIVVNTFFNKLTHKATHSNYLECFILAFVLEVRWLLITQNR